MEIDRVTLQSMGPSLGTDLAIRYCIPLAMYMLLKANSYLPDDLEPDKFCFDLDREKLGSTVINPKVDWSRPALTKFLRHKYGATIISWMLGWPPPTDFPAMTKAGYIETEKEIEFFKSRVEGRSVEEIVKAGYPVAATMEPGFGTDQNKNIHAVILLEWRDDTVIVIDPDARNKQTEFSPERVRQFISPKGGGTVILPKDE